MKVFKRLIFTLLFVSLGLGSFAQTYEYPKYQSGHDIAEWNMRGGHIASGAYTPSGTASEGALFYDITTSTQPLLYRYTDGDWAIVAGGGDSSGGGSGDTATITQAINDNAAAIATNTGDISALDASLTEHIETQIDPHGATMTVTQSQTIGTGTADASIAWVNPGTLLISSYTQIPYEAVEPSGISSDSVTLWANPVNHALQVYNGNEWLDVGVSSGSSALVEQYHNVDIVNPAMVEDFGSRWAWEADISDYRINAVEYLTDGILLLGTTDNSGQLFKSVDYGATWAYVTNFNNYPIEALEYLGNGVVLAGIGGGGDDVYRSTDYGDTWTKVYDGTIIGIISFAYLGNGMVVMGDAGDNQNSWISKSTDYGLTWIGKINTGEWYVWVMKYLGNGVVLAGTGSSGKILKSTDYGENWVVATDTPELEIYSMAYLGNGIVTAGTGDNGYILRSTDYGDNWVIASETGCIDVCSMEYIGNGSVIAGTATPSRILKSTDWGVTWSMVFSVESSQIRAAAYMGDGRAIVGVSSDTSKVYKTEW